MPLFLQYTQAPQPTSATIASRESRGNTAVSAETARGDGLKVLFLKTEGGSTRMITAGYPEYPLASRANTLTHQNTGAQTQTVQQQNGAGAQEPKERLYYPHMTPERVSFEPITRDVPIGSPLQMEVTFAAG